MDTDMGRFISIKKLKVLQEAAKYISLNGTAILNKVNEKGEVVGIYKLKVVEVGVRRKEKKEKKEFESKKKIISKVWGI